jgi:hypothetical protein
MQPDDFHVREAVDGLDLTVRLSVDRDDTGGVRASRGVKQVPRPDANSLKPPTKK